MAIIKTEQAIQKAAVPLGYDLRKLKILLIDDDKLIRDLAFSILNSLGAKDVYVASDALKGYEYFQQLNPDLIVVDWKMEIMDGLEFTKKVRTADNSTNPYVPILMISAFAHAEGVCTARDSGVTEFVAKPFSGNVLLSKIYQAVERPRTFIKTDAFFGPDRRRRDDPFYNGEERRQQSQDLSDVLMQSARKG